MALGPCYSAISPLRFVCVDLPSPSASAHVLASPVTPNRSKPSADHRDPRAGPHRRRPRTPPPTSALSPGPSARLHSQEEAHLLSSEGRGGAAGPCRSRDSEPAREPGGSR